MKLSVRKDGRYWVSELTINQDGVERTARTIHSPPSIFHTKKDAAGFNAFIVALVGDRYWGAITEAEKIEIYEALKAYKRPYDLA